MISLRSLSGLSGLTLLALLAGCRGPAPAPAERASAPAPLLAEDRGGSVQDIDACLERGERVALVFWQTWCGSCRREAPRIVEAQAAHGERLRFLGVVPGSRETVDEAEVEATAKAWGYTFPQIRDYDLSWSKALGVRGTPTIVILGKGREVLYREHRPPEDWASFEGPPLARAPGCPGEVCPAPGLSLRGAQ